MMPEERKSRNWVLPALIALGGVVLVSFIWWTVSIPTTPNLSTRFPTVQLSDPSQGPENAPVTIVAYSDFQCDFCASWNEVAQQALAKYSDQVRLVWKDFPLIDAHPEAQAAAVAARCAQQQFGFWEFHDALFANQQNLGDDLYISIAQDIGLDVQAFTQCRNSGETADLISQSQQEGLALGVSGTPTIFIGQYVLKEAPSFQTVDSLIASLLSSL